MELNHELLGEDENFKEVLMYEFTVFLQKILDMNDEKEILDFVLSDLSRILALTTIYYSIATGDEFHTVVFKTLRTIASNINQTKRMIDSFDITN